MKLNDEQSMSAIERIEQAIDDMTEDYRRRQLEECREVPAQKKAALFILNC